MEFVRQFLAAGLLVWLGLLALILIFRSLQPNETVVSAGILHARDSAREVDPDIAPERVILAGMMPAFALYYIFAALSGDNPSLPDIPQEILTLLTGGNSLYMAGTIARLKADPKKGQS